MDKIIRSIKDERFMAKLATKKEGMFCSLDTTSVMENISKELLTRNEQEVLQNISGSYNINLQIDE